MCFVRLYLRAGRPWLAWPVCGVRTLSLILNFFARVNLNYREITALRGESVSVAEGVSNPWMLVRQLSLVLLVIFAADVALTVRRRGPALGLGVRRRHSIPRFDGNHAGDPGILGHHFRADDSESGIPGPAPGQLGRCAPVDAATRRGCRQNRFHLLG